MAYIYREPGRYRPGPAGFKFSRVCPAASASLPPAAGPARAGCMRVMVACDSERRLCRRRRASEPRSTLPGPGYPARVTVVPAPLDPAENSLLTGDI
jgi:hypothetical protein